MSQIPETLLKRIRAIMPELNIETVEHNQEGLINDVVVVNRELVFRFAKTERYADFLDIEMNILDLVRPNLGVGVPTPIHRERGCVAYPFLDGGPLLRETILALNAETQASIAEQLGKFLHGLHTAGITGVDWEIPLTPAPATRERWLGLHGRIREKVYPLMLKHQVQWAERLFESVLEAEPDPFDYQPALIHGDLAPYHILYDVNRREITGVLDFGVAGIGDAALDIGSLITAYGETFVAKMGKTYPKLDEHLPRARFYSQAIELQWILLGLESGETFWFTAHLGNARDVKGNIGLPG